MEQQMSDMQTDLAIVEAKALALGGARQGTGRG
jgi:hypothetical protein